MDSTCDTNKDLFTKVGMRFIYMINITWLFEYDWYVVWT